MKNFAKIKKLLTSVFEILLMNFRFVSSFCFCSIYKHRPKVIFFLIMAVKRTVFLGWEEQRDEVKLIGSSC